MKRIILFLCFPPWNYLIDSECCWYSHPGWSFEAVGKGLAWIEGTEFGVVLIFLPVSIPILQLNKGGWIVWAQWVVVARELVVIDIDPGILIRVVVFAVLDQSPLVLQEISWGFERVGLCDWHDLEGSVNGADLLLHRLTELDIGSIRWLVFLTNLNWFLIYPHEAIFNRSDETSGFNWGCHKSSDGKVLHFIIYYINSYI